MKLPRWLVWSMLGSSVLATIASVGWWWIRWPTQTIREFTALLEQGQFDEADQFLKRPSRLGILKIDGEQEQFVVFDANFAVANTDRGASYPARTFQSWCTLDNLQMEPRSLSDWILGRQQFSFHRTFTTPVFVGGYAEHGIVVFRCEAWAASAF